MMSVVHFQCPCCQAPLRLENRALFVGRMFDCPDCSESLLIEADGNSGVKAKRLRASAQGTSEGTEIGASHSSRPSRATRETASKVSDRGVDLQSPRSVWDRLSRRPALLGWIVAAFCAVVLLAVVNSGRPKRLADVDTLVADDKKTAEVASQELPEPNLQPADKLDPPLPESNEQPPVAVVASVTTKPHDKPDESIPDVAKDSIPDRVPPAGLKPAVEEPMPAAVPAPPEPAAAPASIVNSVEAIETRLRQRIARFDQVKPVALVKLLDTVEELAGVPIVWDLHIADEQFQKQVTVRLKETTVGEILDTLLKQVGLERRIVEGKIELLPRTEPEPRL